MHPWQLPAVVEHSMLLLDNYERLLGAILVSRDGSPLEQAERLFDAPFVVLSHGTEDDPVFNYGNRAALDLWETDWETLVRMPSRLSAEAEHRAERSVALSRATDGCIRDYAGVRISTSGRRFRIDNAVIWSLRDVAGQPRGQAATFARWEYL